MAREGPIGTILIILIVIIDRSTQQKATTPATTTPLGTATTRHYDPNHGFEQYWPGGDWQILGKTLRTTTLYTRRLSPLETTTTTQPTTQTMICGEYCSKWHQSISAVCVLPINAKFPKLNEYKTMSYCQYLKESSPSCNGYNWAQITLVFVHVGKCSRNIVAAYSTPEMESGKYPEWYTPDTFEMGGKARLTQFRDKFYDPKLWTKHYSGSPYKVVFENFP